MYRMMIIDDEAIVREGLKKLIRWEEYQFEICAEGIDGIDGLEKVLLYQPELVLVDIKMPGMSGLELIKHAKDKGFKGTFIILTGYSDFDFARTAITLGVREYLLKPIDEDELAKDLIKIAEELDEKNYYEQYIENNEQSAKHELLRRLLLCEEEKDILHKQIKACELNFKYPTFCVAILSKQEKEQNVFIEYPSEEKLALMLTETTDVERVFIEDKWVLISKGKTYHEFLQRLLVNNEKVEAIYKEKYFISIGHDVFHMEDIHYSYECARLLLEYQFTYQNQVSVSIRAFEESKGMVIDNLFENIYSQIEIGDLEGLTSSFHMIEEYCRLNLLKESEVKILLTHNLFQLKVFLENGYEQKQSEFPNYNDLMQAIRYTSNLVDLLNLSIEYCKKLSEVVADSSEDNVIMRVSVYVEKNYQKDLKLESIAKMFNYNSAYLGKLFKKEVGENFNNFLERIRIENAKKMLLDTDLKVYQVSERVGYSNIDYFYAKFKRYVGISPKEFKKSL